MSRSRARAVSRRLLYLTITALALAALPACEPPPSGVAARPVPALRLAGVDLLYALRRVATGAELVLCVDELRSPASGPELSARPVDVDLPAGPVRDALRALQRHTRAFEFEFRDPVIYVRSRAVDSAATALDAPLLEAGEFEGNLEQLARALLESPARALLSVARIPGEPLLREVELSIPPGASAVDVLLLYAAGARYGWVMRRAGYRDPQARDDSGRRTYVLSTVELTGPLSGPERVRRLWRRSDTLLHALASASRRLDTPLLIVDRAVRGDIRGRLYTRWNPDPGLGSVDATLEQMSRGRGERLFSHARVGGVAVLRVVAEDAAHPGERLLRRTLRGGTFSGSLGELARWIHARLPREEGARLMAGEITATSPRARIEIPTGSSVQEVLRRFASASRSGVNVVLRDAGDGAWRGAYLQSLAELTIPEVVPRAPG